MPQLELVIRGAEVYDGTGGPPRKVDIGILEGRIAALGDGLLAKELLDGQGLCAAPGFLDTHSHSDLKVLEAPLLEMKLRQGVTFELFGQDGISIAPVREEEVATRRRQLAGLLTDPPLAWGWRSVADYLLEVERARPALDVGYLVPHGAVREGVMGLVDRPATDSELVAMKALLAQGLSQGAQGLSTGLIYPPCCYSDTRELIALCEVAAAHRVPVVVHMRSESDRILEAMEEMFEVGRACGVHVHISHFKIAGKNNWPKLGRVVATVEAAAREGIKVTADQYPYVAGSTMMGAILPPWAHVGGAVATVARLSSPTERARLRAQLLDPAEVEWDNFWKWSGPEGILIADIPSGKKPQWVGKSVKQAADLAGQEPLEFALDLLRDERMGVAMVSFSQSEEVVESFMKLPYVNACTDGLLGGRPHPRAYGTYPRILGRYVRERGTLGLSEAVRKLSGLPADTFGLSEHGYLAVGKRANVVLFDAATVADTATFEEPLSFPKGVPMVLVGGKLVVNDAVPTGERPGRVFRLGVGGI